MISVDGSFDSLVSDLRDLFFAIISSPHSFSLTRFRGGEFRNQQHLIVVFASQPTLCWQLMVAPVMVSEVVVVVVVKLQRDLCRGAGQEPF